MRARAPPAPGGRGTSAATGAPIEPGASDELGRIPVRLVAGKLVTTCDLSSPSRRIPVNLFVELDTLSGLQLHNRAAAALRIESASGGTIPLKLHFPGFELALERREHGDEDLLDEFTKYHSAELGETAVVGVLGSEIFAGHHLVLDLAAGVLELGSPRAAGDPIAATEGGRLVPITEHAGLVWLPVRVGVEGRPAAVALGSSRYDTLVDELVCEEEGRPAGDLPRLAIDGALEVTRYVALRPEEVVLAHPDGVAGLLGLSFLEHFRVEIDRTADLAILTETRPADFPHADLAFFRARATEEAAALERYLEEHASARLSHEAAELLLDRRLSELAGPEEVRAAIAWIDRTTKKDLRATRMLDLLRELADEGRTEVAVEAGRAGIPAGRDDRYPNAVHHLHGEVGHLLLEAGESREAWRHLLSAAFGLPDDGMINLDLGRYYEQEGRQRRAFSRYVQACIRPESGPRAIEALQRLEASFPEGERFSVELVERMVAGKVRSFGAATRYEPNEERPARRVALVELFTNAHLGDGSRGAIGGALGNQGLIAHFPPEHVAFLSYHLLEPRLEPLVNELALRSAEALGVDGPWLHLVGGTERGPGAARWHEAEAVYELVRAMVLEELARPSAHGLELEARLEDGRVVGRVVATGPPAPGFRIDDVYLLQVVLAEAGVLFPGESEVVVHRMVARAPLTPQVLGVEYRPTGGRLELAFERSLAEVAAENERFLDGLEAAGKGSTVRMSLALDPAQLRVVAFLRERKSGAVVQAAQVDPAGMEEDP